MDLYSATLLIVISSWTAFFAVAYVLWVYNGTAHIFASIASSLVYLFVTTILWVSAHLHV
jgi:hypothetical protein